MNASSLPPRFKAAADVLRPVVAVSSALVGLTAVVIAIGWRALLAYYSELGGSWIIRIEPVASLIYEGTKYVLPAAAFLLLGFLYFAHGWATSVGLRRASIGVLFVGGALCVGPALFPEPPSPSTALSLTYLGAAFVSASAGLTVAEIIARYHEQGSKWHPYFVWLLYLSVLYGFLWSPSLVGGARARADLDLTFTSLPMVETTEQAGTGLLRLVAVSGDQAILLALASEATSRRFKVIALKDLKAIHSSRNLRQ